MTSRCDGVPDTEPVPSVVAPSLKVTVPLGMPAPASAAVRKAADDLLSRGKPFDVIIANAGVMACPQGKTQDGFETQFGTNHLGHFVFVNKLVPLLKSGARIVTLSSAGHQISDVDIEDPNFERTPYQPFTAYGRSKTANILFGSGPRLRKERVLSWAPAPFRE